MMPPARHPNHLPLALQDLHPLPSFRIPHIEHQLAMYVARLPARREQPPQLTPDHIRAPRVRAVHVAVERGECPRGAEVDEAEVGCGRLAWRRGVGGAEGRREPVVWCEQGRAWTVVADSPRKQSGGVYTSLAISPPPSSATRCQSFTYSPSPSPLSHSSSTCFRGRSHRSNSENSRLLVSATGTTWSPYRTRAAKLGAECFVASLSCCAGEVVGLDAEEEDAVHKAGRVVTSERRARSSSSGSEAMMGLASVVGRTQSRRAPHPAVAEGERRNGLLGMTWSFCRQPVH